MFKVAFAELNKLFKMPLTYFILLIVLAFSFLPQIFYSPTIVESTQVNLNTTNAYQSYILFNSENYKNSYDESMEQSLQTLNYFKALNNRQTNINAKYEQVLVSYDEMINEIPNGETALLKEKYISLKNAVNSLWDTYLNFDELSGVAYVTTIANSPNFVESINSLTTLLEKINYYDATYSNKAVAANALKNYYNTENYSSKLNLINSNSLSFIEITLNNMLIDIETALNEYLNCMDNSTSAYFMNGTYANQYRKTLINEINTYKSLYNQIITCEYSILFCNAQTKLDLESNIDIVLNNLNLNETNSKSYTAHKSCVANLRDNNFLNNIKDFNNQLLVAKISSSSIQSISALLTSKLEINKNEINEKINAHKNDLSNIKDINHYIVSYKLLSESIIGLINNTAILETIKNINPAQLEKLDGYNTDKFSQYACSSKIVLYNYCIENNIYTNDFTLANEFNVIVDNVTATDYTIFATRLLSILLIIITCIMAGLLITRELKQGTMRLLVIRPISRNKIISGKILSIILLNLIFLIFGFISICFVSSLLFPASVTSTILAIFNGQSVLLLSSKLYVVIYALLQIFEIAFYSFLFVMISILIRNAWVAITTSILSTFALFGLNALCKLSIINFLLPASNAVFTRFLSGLNFTNTVNIIDSLFGSPNVSTMNLWVNLIIYIAYIATFSIISHITFNKRNL